MGPTALLPLRKKSCYGFLSPLKNPLFSASSEPANIGSCDKHDNQWATEEDILNDALAQSTNYEFPNCACLSR
jgi:hypothetical protein